jgi:hypothetical protein
MVSKMAEFDFEGWHADPIENFKVWGDFDVNIQLTKNIL